MDCYLSTLPHVFCRIPYERLDPSLTPFFPTCSRAAIATTFCRAQGLPDQPYEELHTHRNPIYHHDLPLPHAHCLLAHLLHLCHARAAQADAIRPPLHQPPRRTHQARVHLLLGPRLELQHAHVRRLTAHRKFAQPVRRIDGVLVQVPAPLPSGDDAQPLSTHPACVQRSLHDANRRLDVFLAEHGNQRVRRETRNQEGVEARLTGVDDGVEGPEAVGSGEHRVCPPLDG